MGKKRVIKLTEEQLLEEKEKIDKALRKEAETKTLKAVREGRLYISSSYNNTIVTLTDTSGNVLASASAGSIGFKGTKKGSPFAASKVGEVILEKIRRMDIEGVVVLVKGIGAGRESVLRTLAGHGLNIVSIEDITPIPHNGCRPPKVRRV